jgi:hypothetical protein
MCSHFSLQRRRCTRLWLSQNLILLNIRNRTYVAFHFPNCSTQSPYNDHKSDSHCIDCIEVVSLHSTSLSVAKCRLFSSCPQYMHTASRRLAMLCEMIRALPLQSHPFQPFQCDKLQSSTSIFVMCRAIQLRADHLIKCMLIS